MGEILLLGLSASKLVDSLLNILVLVLSWQWVYNPITASYLVLEAVATFIIFSSRILSNP